MRFNFNIDDIDLMNDYNDSDNDIKLSKSNKSEIFKKDQITYNNIGISIESVMLKELCFYKFYNDDNFLNTYSYEIVRDKTWNSEIYRINVAHNWMNLFYYLDNYLKCKNWTGLSSIEINDIKHNKNIIDANYNDNIYTYVQSLDDDLDSIIGIYISSSQGLSCIVFKDQKIEFRLTRCKDYKDCYKNPSEIELTKNQQKICKLLGTGSFLEPYKNGFVIWWSAGTTSIPQIVKNLLGKYASHKNTIAIQTFHQTCLYHFKPDKNYAKTRLLPDGVLIKRYRASNKNESNPVDMIDFEINQSNGIYNVVEFQYMSYDDAVNICNNMQ